MSKRIVVQTTVWVEDSESYKRELEWHVRRSYAKEELTQLRFAPVDAVLHDLKPDMHTMLDKVLA
jgi:hypothetical protein